MASQIRDIAQGDQEGFNTKQDLSKLAEADAAKAAAKREKAAKAAEAKSNNLFFF